MPSNAMPRPLLGLLLGIALLIPSAGMGQEEIIETQPPGGALQPTSPEAYQPCSGEETGRAPFCLADRLELVEDLRQAAFRGNGSECELVFPEPESNIRFRCGELIIVFPEEQRYLWLKWILNATNGTVAREWTYSGMTLMRLDVAPGTERNALFNVVFFVHVLWVDFNRIEVEAVDPRGSR